MYWLIGSVNSSSTLTCWHPRARRTKYRLQAKHGFLKNRKLSKACCVHQFLPDTKIVSCQLKQDQGFRILSSFPETRTFCNREDLSRWSSRLVVTFNTDPVDYMPLSSLDFEQKNSSTGAIKLAERNNYQLQTLS